MNLQSRHAAVLSRSSKFMSSIILNRPDTLNSLNIEMIASITGYLKTAFNDNKCKFILFYGKGTKGFCGGGDVKELAQKVKEKEYTEVNLFFEKEYALNLMIHESPKPIAVIADGVTMGGGLGIAAGASIVMATQRTRMAMPETKIGFFPDVGATGWMFSRCPRGYPEYLGLTGYDMVGAECVRLGFATHFIKSENIPEITEILENYELEDGISKETTRKRILEQIARYLTSNIPVNQDMDDWVATYFSGKSDLNGILDSLSKCELQQELCDKVFVSIAERSPTALVLTLKLLRRNEGRPLPDVFATELKAAKFIIRHPDYLEGIRARLIDRDDKPIWKPDKLAEVDLANLKI